MTQPTPYGSRLAAPPPGVPAPERRIARIRGRARGLFLGSVLLIGVAAAVGYYYGHLPEPFQDWMLLAAAGTIVALLVVVPWLVWLSRTYTITTRRVIVRSGLVARSRQELTHARGYDVRVRRGPLQRLRGAGTLTLSNGVDSPLRLVDIPRAELVHEVLVDQVEVSQILAHRDAQRPATSENPSIPG